MLYKLIADIDYDKAWRTIVIEMKNTIENPNIYIVHTNITNGYKTIYETTEIKDHEQAFKYFISFKKGAETAKNCCGLEINHKQNLITEKNAYISEFEFIKRFLWE